MRSTTYTPPEGKRLLPCVQGRAKKAYRATPEELDNILPDRGSEHLSSTPVSNLG